MVCAVARFHGETGLAYLFSPGGQVLRGDCGLAPQGDVLITSCTYNTEDRKLATVVSHPELSLPPAREHVRPGCPSGDF